MISAQSPVSVGFASVNLMEMLRTNLPAELPVEVRAVFFRQEGRNSVYLVSDFMDFNLLVVDTLKRCISPYLPEGTEIHIVTTHNHGGLTWESFDLEKFGALASRCAVNAMENCRPALVRAGRGELRRPLTLTRRLFVPELDGTITCFFGIPEEENRNGAPNIEAALHEVRDGRRLSYCARMATNRPYEPFAPADPEVHVLEFIASDDHAALGRIIRFACHACCCNRGDCISADYPGYLRKIMDSTRSGVTVFLNGPCGEIAPAIPGKSPEYGKRLAEALAEEAFAVLDHAETVPLTRFEDHLFSVELPVRSEVLENRVVLPSQMPEALPERKKYMELQRLKENLGFLREKYTAGESAPEKTIRVSCSLLRLNRQGILFLPGETFSSTGKKIREALPDIPLITVTEHGRTVMYLPPSEEFAKGGYEMTCALSASGSEAILRTEIISWLRKTGEDSEWR